MVEVEMTSDTVEVDAGDEVILRLPENAMTGYVWSIHSIGEGLLLIGDTTAPGASQHGSGGTRVLRLRAVGPTGDDVVLHLRRGWETEPLERRRITVKVRQARRGTTIPDS